MKPVTSWGAHTQKALLPYCLPCINSRCGRVSSVGVEDEEDPASEKDSCVYSLSTCVLAKEEDIQSISIPQ